LNYSKFYIQETQMSFIIFISLLLSLVVINHGPFETIDPSFKTDVKQRKINFENNILMIGCGAVAQCALPIIVKDLGIKPQQITVIDFVDNRYRVQELIDKGMKYEQLKIAIDNFRQILSTHLKHGDIIIDFSFDISTIDLLSWCRENGVRYLNTSFELWNAKDTLKGLDLSEHTLYARHMKLRPLIKSWGSNDGPTAIIDHGANPGLVSSLTKQALEDIAKKIITEMPTDQRVNNLQEALNQGNFAKLAQLTGVKTIHISERDTQITNVPKKVNEFVNTWSIIGLEEEATAPAEIGWGTHERILPKGIRFHQSGPKNQVYLESMGMNTYVRSWVPSGPIIGMVIRHGEAFSISDKLTVWQDSKAVYRPTVHYAYLPSDSTINSLYEFKMHDQVMQPNVRVLFNEIIKGDDELGVLLMGHDYNAWWIGSILDINESRELVPHQNATTVQVAASAVAAVKYLINHPNMGVLLPDDLDHHEIIDFALPYLGKFVSMPTDWNLLQHNSKIAKDDMWQFSSFLVN
jgi:homospermidine synthase